MRDFETAEIAIRGALTGHLVFSTLHTNDSVGGITRLLDMGVEPFLVASSVRAFLAQRLVRTLCQDCKKPGHYPESYLKSIGFPMHEVGKIHTAVGCPKCRGSGYTGRAAIYEVCMITERMAELISDRANPTVLKKAAQEEGLIPLRRYGYRKVIQGRTTLEEVLRVTTVDQKEDEPQEVAVA
jgi:type II secretory ATPase GspE/PulE/Tfp pilus assembly ATPase PilB-like protein